MKHIKKFQDEIVRLNAENRQLEVSKAHEHELRLRCESTIKDLVAENVRVSSTLTKAESELLKHRHETEAGHESQAELFGKLHKTIFKLEGELKIQKSSSEERESTQLRLIEDLNSKQLEISKLQDELMHANDQIEQGHGFIQQLQNDYSQLKFDFGQCNLKREQLEKDHSKQSKKLEECTAALDQAQKTLFDIKKKTELFGKVDAIMKILPVDDLQSLRQSLKDL